MLDRLEEKSVLRRERCTEDRRVVYLRITESGHELLPQLREAALHVLGAPSARIALPMKWRI